MRPANPKLLSASVVVDHYVAAGVPEQKIVLGVPFYGRAWGQVPTDEHGLYQPGKETATPIRTGYADLKRLAGKDGFTRQWDAVSAVPFLYNGQQQIFISYDDPQSMRLKSQYVLDRGLGGVMFWELSSDADDDLLGAINETLSPPARP